MSDYPKWNMAETPDELEAFYQSVLPKMQWAARQCGYALGVHGSMRRDMDLIAAPWVPDHCDHRTLLHALQSAACGIVSSHYAQPGYDAKPCGRRAYTFAIGMHAIVDVSIMPDTDRSPDRSTCYPYDTPQEFIAALQEKNK